MEIAATDANAVSGLGNVTLKCQFDANSTDMETINLEVAGQPHDPNLVVEGVDNNFSTANFVIHKLVVGYLDANDNKKGATVNLVNGFENGTNDYAVYVKTLEIVRGGVIHQADPNEFRLY